MLLLPIWLRLAKAGSERNYRMSRMPMDETFSQGASLPDSLKKIHEILFNEVSWLHIKRQTLRQLYTKDADQEDTLWATGGVFFRNLLWTLSDDLVLSICRLLDPATHGKKQNAVLESVLGNIEDKDKTLKSQLTLQLDQIRKQSAKLLEMRNQQIAHLDLHTNAESRNPKYDVPDEEIDIIIEAIKSYLGSIDLHFGRIEVPFRIFDQDTGVSQLLTSLQVARKTRRDNRDAALETVRQSIAKDP